MQKILHFWKQGWKFQLAMLLFNVCCVVIFLPLVWLLNVEKHSYYAIAIPLYVIVLVPIGGYVAWLLKPRDFLPPHTETHA